MKKIYSKLTENSFQLLAMMAGALVFAVLFWSFTGNQNTTEKLLGFSTNYDKQAIS